MRITLWRLGLALTALVWAGAASGQSERLAIATAYFPEQWGNPFSSTSITRQPTWSAIFDPLTFVTTEGDLLPWLATDWTQTGPNAWHISLRNDVMFSNGEEMDAAAVVAAVNFVTSETGRATPVGRELDVIAGARALGSTQVEITTRRPDPLLPYKLAMLRPLAPGQWQREGADAYFADPPGTGPYEVIDTAPAQTTFRAVRESWRTAPADTLEILVLSDPAARQAALATGRVQIAIGAVSPDEFDALRQAGGDVFIDRIPAVVSLSFNTVRDTPFRDHRVREAVIHAVDRQAIVDILLGGETVVASQPATRSAFGHDPEIQPRVYDPGRAQALLNAAGYPDGFEALMEMPSGAILYTDVFQQVAADLARVGITLTVRTTPQIKFLENIQTGAWAGDAMAIPFFTPVTDALYPMRQNSCLWHAAYYCDQEAADLIEQALAETDLEERARLTRAVMARSHETAQALFLYETVQFIGLGPGIESFRSDFSFIRYELIEVAGE